MSHEGREACESFCFVVVGGVFWVLGFGFFFFFGKRERKIKEVRKRTLKKKKQTLFSSKKNSPEILTNSFKLSCLETLKSLSCRDGVEQDNARVQGESFCRH